MEKLDPKTDGSSKDIVADNIEKLKTIFPEIFSEEKVDFTKLKETLGEYAEDREERYNFTWHGKSQARRMAQTQSTGTLRPCKEESKNWDTTQNLFIEGDNLEVLKLLQKTYHKKVKMIYIDPPYNTGKEFIYPDNYRENMDTYLAYTGQKDDEGYKFSSNTEQSGRYHTNWLSMMYPRLKLARNLLRDDGVIFISIDENEAGNLQKISDEIFGEDSFICQFVWEKKYTTSNNIAGVSNVHEYVFCYAKNINWISDSISRLPYTEEALARYKNPDKDSRGKWMDCSYHGPKKPSERPNLNYAIIHPKSGEEIWPIEKSWAYERASYEKHVKEDRLWWGNNNTYKEPRLKKFLSEMKGGLVPRSLLAYKTVGGTSTGRDNLRQIFGKRHGAIFDNPKPVSLIRQLLNIGNRSNEIVLDFFAGSATTAHATIHHNVEDIPNGNQKYIMIQLPEPCGIKTEAFKADYKNIADIGKERIRRAGEKILEENKDKEGIENLDIGFKVFKLDSSNIKAWDADFDNLNQSLFDAVHNIKEDRTEEDVLYELLLKYGLDLTLPIEERTIGKKTVYSIGFGALVICLDSDITLDVVEGIGKLKDELEPEIMRVVFKDSGFKDDVVKTNAIQILKRYDIEDVKSL
ncbi:MAG: site-specific DNA-methyltransferase [Proteobacteria bacterium]|nr:site-specific DNA-methyltransferase [Pseudomonadota bacterium]